MKFYSECVLLMVLLKLFSLTKAAITKTDTTDFKSCSVSPIAQGVDLRRCGDELAGLLEEVEAEITVQRKQGVNITDNYPNLFSNIDVMKRCCKDFFYQYWDFNQIVNQTEDYGHASVETGKIFIDKVLKLTLSMRDKLNLFTNALEEVGTPLEILDGGRNTKYTLQSVQDRINSIMQEINTFIGLFPHNWDELMPHSTTTAHS